MATAALIALGITFVRGSGWHFYPSDRPLDAGSRARLETIHDEVDASGKEAVRWLDAALAPDTDATAVRMYLISAQEALEATGDAGLAETAQELRTIILEIRPEP